MSTKQLLQLCAALLLFISANAQELDPVTVTESLQRQQLRKTGRNITILTREEIRQLPVHSLDELLRYAPGVEVQQRGPQGAQSDLVIRGGTYQQVLVVVDGVRLNDPLTGHFSSYLPVHMEDIERIEVIKGAAAAVFGPDAVGGVIQIITRKAPEKDAAVGHQLAAGITAGSYGLLNYRAWASREGKGSLLSAGYQHQGADGPALRGTTSYFFNDLASIQFSKRLDDQWKLALRAAYDSRDFNAQNFYTTFLSDTAKETVRSTWQQATVSREKGASLFTVLLGAKQLKDVYFFRPSSAPNQNRSNLYNADIRHSYRFTKGNARLTTGIQLFSRAIRSNDRGNHALLHSGVYALLQHSIKEQWFFTESLRGDWDERYGWVLVPQFNAAWVGKLLSVRGSIGRGIRDADFTERYNNYNKTLVTGGSIGNPWLTAEKSLNWELGADLFLPEGMQLRTTYFQRSQSELIDWITTPYANMPRKDNLSPTGTFALARNFADVSTRGVELDLGGKHSFGKSNLRWNTGLIWLESKAAGAAPLSFYLSSHARWLWNSSFLLSNSFGSISFTTLYKQRARQVSNALNAEVSKDYFIANIRLEKYAWKQQLSFLLQVDNLFDRSYSDLLGSRMPGRWISGGVTLRLN